jgi:hypothetical protein
VGPVSADMAITLAPMQIRSFVVSIRRGSQQGSWDFGPYGRVEPCSASENGPGPADKAAVLKVSGGPLAAAGAESQVHRDVHTHGAGALHTLDADTAHPDSTSQNEPGAGTIAGSMLLFSALRHRHADWWGSSRLLASEHADASQEPMTGGSLPPPLWLFDLMLLWPLGLVVLLVASLTLPGVKRSRRSSTGLQLRKSTTGWLPKSQQP